MEEVFLSIADITIRVRFLEGEWTNIIKRFKKDFFNYLRLFIIRKIDRGVDFDIDIVERKNYEVIARNINGQNKQFVSFLESKNPKKATLFYQNGFFLLQLALKTLLTGLVTENKGFQLHASAVAIGNKAYIFLGKATAGKSTIMTLLKRRHQPLADDLVIVKKENKVFRLYPTPFVEKQTIKKTNRPYAIGALFFLVKANQTKAKEITDKSEIAAKLLPQLWTDRGNSLKQTRLALEFMNFFSFYDLFFTKEAKPLIKLIKNHELQN